MKRNGFTIMELISIIALLSIVAVILVPSINEAIKTSRADQLEDIRENTINATEVYLNSSCGSSKHDDLVKDGNIRIYLSEINDCGLIDNRIYNPMNGEYFDINDEYVDAYIDDVGLIDYTLSF